ncbi:uncharacterized protein Polr1F [Periplaneta americana]|uniref:uncharacterized protein Polr1F n=1 Tax=Periplaneta americana TaxID=6978 RepID=UPI0037E77F75
MNSRSELFSAKELRKLITAPTSRVREERRIRHIALHPSSLGDVKSAIHAALDSYHNKFDEGFKGFILGYKNVKILTDKFTIINDDSYVHLDVEADFYIFTPEVGHELVGIVNKKSSDHIGCLVHKYFNVSLPRPNDELDENWPWSSLNIGDEVTFKINFCDFTGRLPYIRGKLLDVRSTNISLIDEVDGPKVKSKKRKHEGKVPLVADDDLLNDGAKEKKIKLEFNTNEAKKKKRKHSDESTEEERQPQKKELPVETNEKIEHHKKKRKRHDNHSDSDDLKRSRKRKKMENDALNENESDEHPDLAISDLYNTNTRELKRKSASGHKNAGSDTDLNSAEPDFWNERDNLKSKNRKYSEVDSESNSYVEKKMSPEVFENMDTHNFGFAAESNEKDASIQSIVDKATNKSKEKLSKKKKKTDKMSLNISDVPNNISNLKDELFSNITNLKEDESFSNITNLKEDESFSNNITELLNRAKNMFNKNSPKKNKTAALLTENMAKLNNDKRYKEDKGNKSEEDMAKTPDRKLKKLNKSKDIAIPQRKSLPLYESASEFMNKKIKRHYSTEDLCATVKSGADSKFENGDNVLTPPDMLFNLYSTPIDAVTENIHKFGKKLSFKSCDQANISKRLSYKDDEADSLRVNTKSPKSVKNVNLNEGDFNDTSFTATNLSNIISGLKSPSANSDVSNLSNIISSLRSPQANSSTSNLSNIINNLKSPSENSSMCNLSNIISSLKSSSASSNTSNLSSLKSPLANSNISVSIDGVHSSDESEVEKGKRDTEIIEKKKKNKKRKKHKEKKNKNNKEKNTERKKKKEKIHKHDKPDDDLKHLTEKMLHDMLQKAK